MTSPSPFTYASDVLVFLVGADGALLVGTDGEFLVAGPITQSWQTQYRGVDASARPVIARYDE